MNEVRKLPVCWNYWCFIHYDIVPCCTFPSANGFKLASVACNYSSFWEFLSICRYILLVSSAFSIFHNLMHFSSIKVILEIHKKNRRPVKYTETAVASIWRYFPKVCWPVSIKKNTNLFDCIIMHKLSILFTYAVHNHFLSDQIRQSDGNNLLLCL